jgi:hypothetical protein
MANEEHLKILKQGVDAWNRWREANPEILPDLREADLAWAELGDMNFRGANLDNGNLTGAKLSGTNLRWASLHGANLSWAALNRTDLRGANLSGANLHGADLRRANISMPDLSGADFSEAQVGFTTFAFADLSTIKGIETIQHAGPSTIGIDTIYRSEGKIPIRFLRGAGVPDNFIEYMSSLVGTAFEFYSCFISYSGKDQEFAARIHADLQDNGVRCWFATHHVQAGKKLHEQIDSAIRLHERLLLILSPDSINSEWVKTEIAKARKREIQEDKRVLFPVRLHISYEQL